MNALIAILEDDPGRTARMTEAVGEALPGACGKTIDRSAGTGLPWAGTKHPASPVRSNSEEVRVARINWLRVLMGGVVAGVVIGTVQAFLIPMLSGSFDAAVDAMGGPSPGLSTGAAGSAGFFVAGTATMFAVGIFTIWLYASIRPRYGAGMKTAAIAGLAVWFAITLAELLLSLLTNLTVAHIATTHGPNIVTFVVAAIAGAWVYREETPARHSTEQSTTTA